MAGIKSSVIDPIDLKTVLNGFVSIGELTGSSKKAHELVNLINSQVTQTQNDPKKRKDKKHPRTIRLMEADPAICAGKNSFMRDVIRLAGGTNPPLPNNNRYPKLTAKQIKKINPEAIYLCGWTEEQVADLANLPGWQDTKAVKENRILVLPWGQACRCGPRIGFLVRQLAKALHPRISP